jgi:hypothetical protein
VAEVIERRYKIWKEDGRIDIAKAVDGYKKWPVQFTRQLVDLEQAIDILVACRDMHLLTIQKLLNNPVQSRKNLWGKRQAEHKEKLKKYQCALERSRKDNEECTMLLRSIQSGEYEHPRLVVAHDGLGDGSWLSIERY